MTRSLLYVSTNLVEFPDRQGQIESIVDVARARNRTLEVTGALISTETAFAQVLEGSADMVEEVMASIRRDTRHTDLRVVSDQEIKERRFPSWSMAYSGRSQYVQRLVDPLRAPDETTEAMTLRLVRFMREFAVG